MVKVVPRPSARLQLDRAADLLDVGPHHVHADAAAGDAGHLFGGREAGREDEAAGSAARVMRGELGLGRQAVLERLLRIRSTSRPRPSSAISMTMWPPSW